MSSIRAAVSPLGLFQQQQPQLRNAASALQQQQRRWNWQIVLKQRVDKETGKLKYDDWSKVIMTMKEPTLVDGTSLQKRSWARKRHIKPTMMKKLVNQRKEYRRSIKRIDDLTNYIKFMNDAKKK